MQPHKFFYMPRYHFSPENKLIVVNNAAYRGEDFCIEQDDGYLIVNALAANDDAGAYAPLYGVIGAKTAAVFGKLQLINWCNGNYDVLCEPEKYAYYAPPSAVAQKCATYNGRDFTATVYKDNRTRFLAECNGDAASYDVPEIFNPEILIQPTTNGVLTVLNAPYAHGEYLLILLYDGKFTKLFETSSSKISFTDRAFTVTEKLNDMLGRVKISEYSFSGVTLNKKSTKFECECENKYPAELMPYLLLEAVRAGDNSTAATYLSDELLPDAAALPSFFGKFDVITCPKYASFAKKSDLLQVAVYSNSTEKIITPRFFKFTLADGKISNISN